MIRALRWREVVLVAVLGGLWLVLLRGRQQDLPGVVVGHLVPVPLAATAALFPAIALVRSCDGPPGGCVTAPVRRIHWLVPTMSVVLPAVSAGIAWCWGGWPSGVEMARDSIGMCGLAMIGVAMTRDARAVALPLLFLAAVFFAGVDQQGHSYPWAWPLHPGRDVTSQVWPIATWAAGVLFCALSRRWWIGER